MRVVLDSNTLVSGVISAGDPPGRLLDAGRAQAFEICSSTALLADLLEGQFKKNYKRLFGFAMPHGDSIQNVMALLELTQIEQLKQKMAQVLIQRKTFHSNRFRGRWYRIAVDASMEKQLRKYSTG